VPGILENSFFSFLGCDEDLYCSDEYQNVLERRMKLSESRTLLQLVKMLEGLLWLGVV